MQQCPVNFTEECKRAKTQAASAAAVAAAGVSEGRNQEVLISRRRASMSDSEARMACAARLRRVRTTAPTPINEKEASQEHGSKKGYQDAAARDTKMNIVGSIF